MCENKIEVNSKKMTGISALEELFKILTEYKPQKKGLYGVTKPKYGLGGNSKPTYGLAGTPKPEAVRTGGTPKVKYSGLDGTHKAQDDEFYPEEVNDMLLVKKDDSYFYKKRICEHYDLQIDRDVYKALLKNVLNDKGLCIYNNEIEIRRRKNVILYPGDSRTDFGNQENRRVEIFINKLADLCIENDAITSELYETLISVAENNDKLIIDNIDDGEIIEFNTNKRFKIQSIYFTYDEINKKVGRPKQNINENLIKKTYIITPEIENKLIEKSEELNIPINETVRNILNEALGICND